MPSAGERTVRFYVGRGLLGGPEGRGTAATYSYRHLLQLLAIKLRQMEGATLGAIEKELAESPGDVLEKRVPAKAVPTSRRHGSQLDPTGMIAWRIVEAKKSKGEPLSRVLDYISFGPQDWSRLRALHPLVEAHFPSVATRLMRFSTQFISEREKSMGKNTTSSPFFCANLVASIEVSIAFSTAAFWAAPVMPRSSAANRRNDETVMSDDSDGCVCACCTAVNFRTCCVVLGRIGCGWWKPDGWPGTWHRRHWPGG